MEEALITIEQNVHEEWQDAFTKTCLLLKYALKHDKKRLMEIMNDVSVMINRRDAEFCYLVAVVFALAELNETSLDWLEQAVNNGFINYPLISEKDIVLKRIRKEERFKNLMKRVKHEWENFDA